MPGDHANKQYLATRANAPATATFLRDWHLYVYEGAELAIFMISACFFDVLLFTPGTRMVTLVPDPTIRRLLMGLSMGLTAVLIIHTPMGKRSGAHFNPAITLTYLRLGKIAPWDALFYVFGQFVGGIAGVGLSALVLGKRLAIPAVNYVVTVPGIYGTGAAFVAEFFMATLLMAVVLLVSNRPKIANYTSYYVGCLITMYVLLFAPVSGFSINPARTVGSAVFAHLWTAVWLYFIAPLGGMLLSAEVYTKIKGTQHVRCAKLHPDPAYPCPFLCDYPGHRHLVYGAEHHTT